MEGKVKGFLIALFISLSTLTQINIQTYMYIMFFLLLLLLLLSYSQNILSKHKAKCGSPISIGLQISLSFHIESGTVKVKPPLRLTRSTPPKVL